MKYRVWDGTKMWYPHTVEIDVSNEPGKHVAKIFGELVERAASAKRYLEKMGRRKCPE